MANVIKLKQGSGSNPQASDLVLGELAIRTDGTPKLFALNDAGNVVGLGGAPDDGSITSAKIADGAIVNADINASAAIDVSKLSGVMPSGGGVFTGDISTRTLTPASGITNADLGASTLKYRNIHLSGNIVVDGYVDNRDIAADGSKLDGIESGATADQSASEIVALIADQTIAPSTIDMEDNEIIKIGNSDDLQLHHNGNNSVIADVGQGELSLQTNIRLNM